jgi:hypothetical protein
MSILIAHKNKRHHHTCKRHHHTRKLSLSGVFKPNAHVHAQGKGGVDEADESHDTAGETVKLTFDQSIFALFNPPNLAVSSYLFFGMHDYCYECIDV